MGYYAKMNGLTKHRMTGKYGKNFCEHITTFNSFPKHEWLFEINRDCYRLHLKMRGYLLQKVMNALGMTNDFARGLCSDSCWIWKSKMIHRRASIVLIIYVQRIYTYGSNNAKNLRDAVVSGRRFLQVRLLWNINERATINATNDLVFRGFIA